jgi:hypothetical protein
MPASVDPSEALRRAMHALQDGDWDRRTVEGARQNALTSIAWSLAGILAHMQDRDAGSAGATRRRPTRRAQDMTLDTRH